MLVMDKSGNLFDDRRKKSDRRKTDKKVENDKRVSKRREDNLNEKNKKLE